MLYHTAMVTSQENQCLYHAKRDHQHYRLENENVHEKMPLSGIIEKVIVSGSQGLHKTELQDLQLDVVM